MADATDGYQYLYQVGDVVRVREDLTYGKYPMDNDNYDGIITVASMIALAGTYVTIREQFSILGHHCYHISEGPCAWTDSMFEYEKDSELQNPDNDWENFFLG